METIKIRKFNGLSEEDLAEICIHLGVIPKFGIINENLTN